MTQEELKKLKRPIPMSFPFAIKDEVRQDEYGVYSTGLFNWPIQLQREKCLNKQ